jgi:hypothetical protein
MRVESGGKPPPGCRILWHTSLKVWRSPAGLRTLRIKDYIFGTYGEGFT